MNKIIERARLHNIKFNTKKLQYCQQEVRFMGLIFNEKGMSADLERINVIKQLKNPKNKKELQQILRVVNLLRQFIPLRELLKKDI